MMARSGSGSLSLRVMGSWASTYQPSGTIVSRASLTRRVVRRCGGFLVIFWIKQPDSNSMGASSARTPQSII